MYAKPDVNYYDTTLAEVALYYMRKKKMKMTTGNLFWIMERILKKLDYINQKGKKINFTAGHCEARI